MSKSNHFVFKGLYIVAWIIFVGLSIEAGALIVNFVFNLFKPELVKNLYEKLDLTGLYDRNPWVFYQMFSFILTIAVLKALLFYTVIMLMHKMDLAKPFSPFVSEQITRLSYYTFAIGILSYMARQSAKRLDDLDAAVATLNRFWADSQAYILMAAVIYVIAIIFKKGVELQTENDLTV